MSQPDEKGGCKECGSHWWVDGATKLCIYCTNAALVAGGRCTCHCHTSPGVKHIAACCCIHGIRISWCPECELAALLGMIARNEGGSFFMGRLDRWLDDPHYRCVNWHVSTVVLKSEFYGGNVCLGPRCRKPLYLTYPEDKDGPLYLKGEHERL